MLVIAALPELDTCVESGSFETASIHDVEAVDTLHLASKEGHGWSSVCSKDE
jgi:hypothetical protein